MNRCCTFGGMFREYLEETIRQGGDVGTMVNLVNAYQDGYPSIRAAEFRDWLYLETFRCEDCRHDFEATGRESEDAYVLCEGCAAREHEGKGKRGHRQ